MGYLVGRGGHKFMRSGLWREGACVVKIVNKKHPVGCFGLIDPVRLDRVPILAI